MNNDSELRQKPFAHRSQRRRKLDAQNLNNILALLHNARALVCVCLWHVSQSRKHLASYYRDTTRLHATAGTLCSFAMLISLRAYARTFSVNINCQRASESHMFAGAALIAIRSVVLARAANWRISIAYCEFAAPI